jgi:hypothetical protein
MGKRRHYYISRLQLWRCLTLSTLRPRALASSDPRDCIGIDTLPVVSTENVIVLHLLRFSPRIQAYSATTLAWHHRPKSLLAEESALWPSVGCSGT